MQVCKHEMVVCPRCQQPFECKVGSINLCQCVAVPLTEAQRYYIDSLYDGCLCAACLLDLQAAYMLQHKE